MAAGLVCIGACPLAAQNLEPSSDNVESAATARSGYDYQDQQTRREKRNRRNGPFVIFGGPVTVGAGSLEPRDPNSTYWLNRERPRWEDSDAYVCAAGDAGPARASTAIARAAHADGIERC